MKGFFAVGLCMLAVAAASPTKASDAEYEARKQVDRSFCMAGTGATEETFEKAKAGTLDPKDSSLWRYTACMMMVKRGSLTVDGKFVAKEMTGDMTQEDADKLNAVEKKCDKDEEAPKEGLKDKVVHKFDDMKNWLSSVHDKFHPSFIPRLNAPSKNNAPADPTPSADTMKTYGCYKDGMTEVFTWF